MLDMQYKLGQDKGANGTASPILTSVPRATCGRHLLHVRGVVCR